MSISYRRIRTQHVRIRTNTYAPFPKRRNTYAPIPFPSLPLFTFLTPLPRCIHLCTHAATIRIPKPAAYELYQAGDPSVDAHLIPAPLHSEPPLRYDSDPPYCMRAPCIAMQGITPDKARTWRVSVSASLRLCAALHFLP